MKKVIIFVLCLAFMVLVVSVAFGRTMEEEKKAVQDYLKVLDAKLAKSKEANDYSKTTMLKAQKAATLSRWNKLKASRVVYPVLPPVAAPVPPPAPVVVKPAPTLGLFGLGLNTTLAGQYIYTGSGSIRGALGVMGNVVLDLGPTFGISGNAVKFKLGAGYFQGGGEGLKAIPVYAGGIISLPQWLGGQDSYLTGGLNYVVNGNGSTSGKIGGDVYFGITADFGLGLGKTGFEIGYNVVRSSTVTSKGISVSVCQPFVI